MNLISALMEYISSACILASTAITLTWTWREGRGGEGERGRRKRVEEELEMKKEAAVDEGGGGRGRGGEMRSHWYIPTFSDGSNPAILFWNDTLDTFSGKQATILTNVLNPMSST